MQHGKLLELVETDIAGMDWNHLDRVRLLLQSDLWLAGSRLDDRERMEPNRIAKMEAERDMIEVAIDKIRKRIQGLSAVDYGYHNIS